MAKAFAIPVSCFAVANTLPMAARNSSRVTGSFLAVSLVVTAFFAVPRAS